MAHIFGCGPFYFKAAMNDEEIWLRLAELFFLDTEFDDDDFKRVAELLKNSGWTPERTSQFLIRYIAPIAGSNLGYLLYPVIGQWSHFDEKDLTKKIYQQIKIRDKFPSWSFFISDWWCEKMLKKLDLEKLLKLI